MDTISTANVTDNIGKTVKFTTLNKYETRLVEGKIEGLVKYDVAKSISDVVSFQAGVSKNPDVIGLPSLESSSFVIIKTLVDEVVQIQAYSIFWILSDEWEVITDENDRSDVTIKLIDVTLAEVDNALLLLANGSDSITTKISAVVVTE